MVAEVHLTDRIDAGSLDGVLHVCRDGAGAQADTADAVLGVFLVDAACQCQYTGLGCTIVAPAFNGIAGSTGADVDDDAGTVFFHAGQYRAQTVVDALEVDVDHLIPACRVGIGQSGNGVDDPGVVDQYVDGTEGNR